MAGGVELATGGHEKAAQGVDLGGFLGTQTGHPER